MSYNYRTKHTVKWAEARSEFVDNLDRFCTEEER